MKNINDTNTIEIVAKRDDSWDKLLFLSDSHDTIPRTLIINFSKDCINAAQNAFIQFPLLNAVSFLATIKTDDAIDIQGSNVTFVNKQNIVLATFYNGETGTTYELNITAYVNHLISENTSKTQRLIREQSEVQTSLARATVGRSIEISLCHLTDDEVETLFEEISNSPPMHFSPLGIELFVLIDYYNENSPGGLGVKINRSIAEKWQAEQFITDCENVNIPTNLANIIYLTKDHHIDVLILESNSQEIKGLPLFKD